MNIFQCVRYVYQTEGIRGFYRGLIVFYVGILEIIICFVIYESLKKYLKEVLLVFFISGIEKNFINFFGFMVVVVIFKGCVFCIVYLYGMFFFFFRAVKQLSGLCRFLVFGFLQYIQKCIYLQVIGDCLRVRLVVLRVGYRSVRKFFSFVCSWSWLERDVQMWVLCYGISYVFKEVGNSDFI